MVPLDIRLSIRVLDTSTRGETDDFGLLPMEKRKHAIQRDAYVY